MSIESTRYVIGDGPHSTPETNELPSIDDVFAPRKRSNSNILNQLTRHNRARLVGGTAVLVLSLGATLFGIHAVHKHEDDIKNEVVTATLLERGFRAHGVSVTASHGGQRLHIGCEDFDQSTQTIALDFNNTADAQAASLPAATQSDVEGHIIIGPSTQTIMLSNAEQVTDFIGSRERSLWCRTTANND